MLKDVLPQMVRWQQVSLQPVCSLSVPAWEEEAAVEQFEPVL